MIKLLCQIAVLVSSLMQGPQGPKGAKGSSVSIFSVFKGILSLCVCEICLG